MARLIIKLILLVSIGFLYSSANAAPKYGLVLPGGWEKLGQRAEAVKQWEAENSDMVFGSLQDVALNRQTTALGYMYAQKLDCLAGEQEAWLHRKLWQQEINPEHLYLHAGVDTVLAFDALSTRADAFIAGKPLHLMIQKGRVLRTARLPLQLAADEALILVSGQPFLAIDTVMPEALTVTAALAAKPGDEISGWQPLTGEILADEGDSKRQLWWLSDRMMAVNPRVGEFVFNTGHVALSAQMPVYVARLSWSQRIVVDRLTIDYGVRRIGQQQLFIPGWDWRNDLDGDGYLDDEEYAQRVNTQASARFASQARLLPVGYMWPGTCWMRTNFSHPQVNRVHQAWYQYDWQRQGLSGAYNDDMAKLLGRNQFAVIQGGTIAEMTTPLGTDEAAVEYAKQMARFFTQLKQQLPEVQLAANISELNLWRYRHWPAELREVFDVWLREHYLYPGMGLHALQRRWEHFALTALGDKSLLMTTTRFSRSAQEKQGEQVWHQDIATGLALYYLFHHPELTYYHSWNQTFYYGSGPTDNRNWYQTGIAKNQAYRPTAMLEHDLGKPVLTKRDPVPWVLKDRQEAEQVGVLLQQQPSGWFWIAGEKAWPWSEPARAIARQFENGLVVYFAGASRADKRALQTEPQTLLLPARYRRVNWDGSVDEASDTLTLSPYEGAVLVK
ncbi:hypothetical protein [Thaumasiovibrio subtropicus]|uniref:hypothetical protein n=1 Tax=Thaumasiovibrio subtropicus TaxID=1891207 RepID=UPI000B34B5B5|nr:hypothetical protein [Thaumasiovibrio subtropicus]